MLGAANNQGLMALSFLDWGSPEIRSTVSPQASPWDHVSFILTGAPLDGALALCFILFPCPHLYWGFRG